LAFRGNGMDTLSVACAAELHLPSLHNIHKIAPCLCDAKTRILIVARRKEMQSVPTSDGFERGTGTGREFRGTIAFLFCKTLTKGARSARVAQQVQRYWFFLVKTSGVSVCRAGFGTTESRCGVAPFEAANGVADHHNSKLSIMHGTSPVHSSAVHRCYLNRGPTFSHYLDELVFLMSIEVTTYVLAKSAQPRNS